MLFIFRVLKQALRGCGPNLTTSHLTMMSLCGLFLLETAKRVDEEFQIPHNSSHHTVRNSEEDVMKMTCYLLEEKVTSERKRDGGKFIDPFTMGAQKIANGYIEHFFQKRDFAEDVDVIESDTQPPTDHEEHLDLSYELYHTT